jgi:hypothetical protein
MQKAMRMVDPAVPGFQPHDRFETMEDLIHELEVPTDRRVFAIAQALHEKTLSVSEIHDITKIVRNPCLTMFSAAAAAGISIPNISGLT